MYKPMNKYRYVPLNMYIVTVSHIRFRNLMIQILGFKS